ncbi:HAD-IA family hydrolase [Polyangium mundeleinium]|uniref:HAD-IA family hydrolase n=1 Tax=Polyangium mundeleinium TaxID=2995306 RepID=A0ABT5EQH5_9BACT|nr:HAD-IA family hydrolase [Polyangium mundeleinium]MDC0743157.1 HAD-IA family hydrolase [Polyangium mundeleinium]
MRRYKTVLFDLDGTLIDSIRLILDSYHHTFAIHGLPPCEDDVLLRGVGTPLKAQLAGFADDPEAVLAMIETYRAYNLAHHDACVRPYPGAVSCVRSLAEAGVKIAVVTSKNRHSTLRGLDVAGLSDVFSILVCADDVTNPKPHKEPVDLALAQLGARPEEAIFVGDSLHDMHAGRSAGVATGAALWGPMSRAHLAPSEPSHWLEKPEDIVPLVLG